METVHIKDEYIKLNQLMKLCGFVGRGSDVKILVDNGLVTLNGKLVTELRKKVYSGDVVKVQDIGEVKVEESI